MNALKVLSDTNTFFYYYHRLKNNKGLIGIVRRLRTIRVHAPHQSYSSIIMGL